MNAKYFVVVVVQQLGSQPQLGQSAGETAVAGPFVGVGAGA